MAPLIVWLAPEREVGLAYIAMCVNACGVPLVGYAVMECLLYHHWVRQLLVLVGDLLSKVVPECGKPWCLVHRVRKIL